MLGENHALIFEFPEHKEVIHHLKESDEEFARMAKEYHDLDHKVRGLEVNGVPTTDQNFMDLKARRVSLKDQLYRRLLNGHG
ncbi:YdcH family protein [Ferrimonas balearica]|uniref:YdcH family protein n=1 Tax=Ferrimonas balearica TaxID=44012 RepID=UPI001C99A9E9|nr:YdcH family protein [Ferrimonas balearica]MBY5992914.1 YdcH family protein [Ferrimonas balearica]